jgi:hypothetical protein
MPTPDTRSSIVITKQFTYRGATRTWSNRYHFEGSVPADSTAWTTLADNITAAEKLVLDPSVEIIQATGYDSASATSTNPHGDAVFAKTYSLTGTFTPGGGDVATPGDAAALVRYSTLARSTKNHPVYLFNYYHSAWRAASTTDDLATDYVAVLNTYAAAWVTGFTDGTGARERCGPRGAGAVGHTVNGFVRHRDFPA